MKSVKGFRTRMYEGPLLFLMGGGGIAIFD